MTPHSHPPSTQCLMVSSGRVFSFQSLRCPLRHCLPLPIIFITTFLLFGFRSTSQSRVLFDKSEPSERNQLWIVSWIASSSSGFFSFQNQIQDCVSTFNSRTSLVTALLQFANLFSVVKMSNEQQSTKMNGASGKRPL